MIQFHCYKRNYLHMATKEEVKAQYISQLEELGVSVDEALLDWVIDRVGPSNYNDDGKFVACSDESEKERVFSGFVGDELQEEDKEKGMQAIDEVCEQMSGINKKYRAVVYYLLAKKYGHKL